MIRLTLLLAVVGLLLPAASFASVSVGVGWSNHDWDRHHWHNRHWYRDRWDHRWNRPWNDPWDHRRWPRHRPQDNNNPTVAPLSQPALTTTTVRSEQVQRDSLAQLPANARTELTEQGRIYRWQQQCYQLNNSDWRYYTIACPE